MAGDRDPQASSVVIGTKRCRYCRKLYASPIGSRPHACPECAPTLEQAIRVAELDAQGVSR